MIILYVGATGYGIIDSERNIFHLHMHYDMFMDLCSHLATGKTEGDTSIFKCDHCDSNPCGCDSYWEYDENRKEGNFSMMFDIDCFATMDGYPNKDVCYNDIITIYNWCKNHHVRCRSYQEYIQGNTLYECKEI